MPEDKPSNDEALHPLAVGDRVQLGGEGYASNWQQAGVIFGSVLAFSELETGRTGALVRLDGPITVEGLTGEYVSLALRYVGGVWGASAVVHVTLHREDPRKGANASADRLWIEDHGVYRRVSRG